MMSLARRAKRALERERHERREYRRKMALFEKLKQDTGYSVSQSDAKRVREYAGDVFGSVRYEPWLLFYTACRGQFVEGWIPQDYFHKLLKTENTSYSRVAYARTLARRIFQSDVFPDIAHYVNGLWLDVDGRPVQPSDVKDLIFSQGDTAFLKTEDSNQGRGIEILSADSFDPEHFSSKKNFVVQRAIRQHAALEDLSPGSVATLRIVTTVRAGEPARFCAAYARCNFDGGRIVRHSDMFFRIGIDENSGQLQDTGMDLKWVRHDLHPVTGVPFSRFSVPHFDDVRSLCLRLHERARQFMIIGWDAAVTDEGRVEMMEWNSVVPGIVFPEVALGPNYRHMEWEKLRCTG